LDACLDVWEGLLDVHHEDEVELPGEIRGTTVRCLVPVRAVVLEEVLLILQSG
jgi:hypothetical protein